MQLKRHLFLRIRGTANDYLRDDGRLFLFAIKNVGIFVEQLPLSNSWVE